MYHYNDHFDVIKSLTGAFDCSYYCRACRTRFEKAGGHKCINVCERCYDPTACDISQPSVKCHKCNRKFHGQQCLNNHLKPLYTNNRAVCDVHRICTKCTTYYNLIHRAKHACNEIYCQLCRKFCDANHRCYMQPFHPNKKKKNDSTDKLMYVFYDIEATQCKPLETNNDTIEHVPNLLVSQQCCTECIDLKIDTPC